VARKILHLDLDAFFCAVEEQRDPTLQNRPFAVGGRPDQRGVVASCSYAARRFGVHSAMPMSRAIRVCPQLIIVPPRFGAYSAMSHQVMEILESLTPLVEQISIDEAFLDVSDLPEPGEVLARRLQAEIRDRLGLPCSLGVATNKLVAKTATDVGKASHKGEGTPNAILVVPPGEEAVFLAPLPVRTLWGVGPKTEARLTEVGLRTIGDLARRPEAVLVRQFGSLGQDLARRARGIDERAVITTHELKSISQETTFARDVSDRDILQRTLRTQSEQVGRRLRRHGLGGTTVKLKLRLPDFTTQSRQTTLSQPTDQDDEIYRNALALFERNWRLGQPVRLLGVGVSGLGPVVRQLSLWDDSQESQAKLQATLDSLRDRFGEPIIRRGSDLTD
jgi:DNA polymerase IV